MDDELIQKRIARRTVTRRHNMLVDYDGCGVSSKKMNAVLLFTFILGFIALASGFAIRPDEKADYNSPYEINGGDKSLDIEGETTQRVTKGDQDVPTTTSTDLTEVTSHTIVSEKYLLTTTPSVLHDKTTTGGHSVPTTTSTAFTEVTPHTTVSEKYLPTTTPSVLHDKTTTGGHNVPTTATATFTEVTPHTTVSEKYLPTTTPSVLHDKTTTGGHSVPTTRSTTFTEVTPHTTVSEKYLPTTTPSVLHDKTTTGGHSVPTTTSTAFTEVTPHTTVSEKYLPTTTPSVLHDKTTTGGHSVPTTTSTAFTEVTPHTTVSEKYLPTTTPSVLHDKTTTGGHNVPTTATATFTEVTPHTTVSEKYLLKTTHSVPSDDDDYHNDCDCPPHQIYNVRFPTSLPAHDNENSKLGDISTVDCANVYSSSTASDLTTQQHQQPTTSTSSVSNDTTKCYSPYSTPTSITFAVSTSSNNHSKYDNTTLQLLHVSNDGRYNLADLVSNKGYLSDDGQNALTKLLINFLFQDKCKGTDFYFKKIAKLIVNYFLKRNVREMFRESLFHSC